MVGNINIVIDCLLYLQVHPYKHARFSNKCWTAFEEISIPLGYDEMFALFVQLVREGI